MQATDSYLCGSPFLGQEGIERLRGRIGELAGEIGKGAKTEIEAALADDSKTPEELRDLVSTRLMEAFRKERSRGCFGLLYELNGHHLLGQVIGRLRRYSSKADPGDVLQEVFFNIYRYPHRFNPARDDAFRVWSAMIVRNTVLKHLRSLSRGGRSELAIDDLPDQAGERSENPLHGAIETESKSECARVYLTYLQLYLRFYSMLSERERRALYLVEVEELSYRHAAADLGIKLENLKMVIFRARKKIHRSMRRVFDGLSPDCRPARDPRAEEALEEAEGVDPRSGGATVEERG
jgi:RNA polymerase sigma-70 factor (ECF subfamily)